MHYHSDNSSLFLNEEIKYSEDELLGFTDSLDLESPYQPTSESSEPSKEKKSQKNLNNNMGEESCQRKSRKNKKVENSPYHNFQKHLNSAIQKLVVLPERSESDD